jgi:hypothetical protein
LTFKPVNFFLEQVIPATGQTERRISVLGDTWQTERRKKTDRGELSIHQFSEDGKMFAPFREFCLANGPLVFVEQITATVLNEYRDYLWRLREINHLEARLAALRELLPVAYRQIYVFACRPEKRVWIYAENSEQAIAKLHDRMNSNYCGPTTGLEKDIANYELWLKTQR